jgi:site-specific recombinase XerD
MTEKTDVDDQQIDAWLSYLAVSRGRTARTVEAYRSALMRLKEFLAGKPLADADAGELEMFCGLWLHKKGVVARSRKPYISAVRGFYAWLKSSGAIKGNASLDLVHPMSGSPLPRAMSLANAEKLMWSPDMGTFIGIRDAAIMSLLIGCGIRVSGLTKLNESSLQTVEVSGQVRLTVRVVEKGNRERIMPVPREAEALLRVYLGHEELASIDRAFKSKGGQEDKVLFVSVRSTMLAAHEHIGENRRLCRRAIWDIVRRHGKNVGIPESQLHPHAMRHLFGTELQEEDTPTLAMQELMGHQDPKSTSIYVHLAMRKKMATVDRAAPLSKMKTPVSELLKRLPR